VIDILQVATLPPALLERLSKNYRIHDCVDGKGADELLSKVGPNIRGILAGGTQGPDANLIGSLPNLEIIVSHSVGFDATDVAAAQSRGVIVTHTPEVLTGDVADLAMTLILMVTRRVGESERFLRRGEWLKRRMDFGVTVKGRTLGILGLGRIGKAVARRAEAFGLNVAFHDIQPLGDLPYRHYPTLLDLAEASDILLVACEGGPANRGLVNRAVLEALGPKGYLVNTARGPIVDQDALIAALQTGLIAGAGLDVFDGEPSVPDALLDMENVVLTPHIASSTHETRRAMADLVVANLDAHFSGKAVLTPVPRQIS